MGDRRFGVRLVENGSGFPWLSASRLPELLLYKPCDFVESCDDPLPTHVQSPAGNWLGIHSDQLRQEISDRIGCDVELMSLKHGIFDDAPISIIASKTISHVCEQAEIGADRRRFRANVVVDLDNDEPFAEDDLIGRIVAFGDTKHAPAIYVTKRDMRCKMIGLDPDTAKHDASVIKATIRLNENNAGVYGTVVRTGRINQGDSIFLLEG